MTKSISQSEIIAIFKRQIVLKTKGIKTKQTIWYVNMKAIFVLDVIKEQEDLLYNQPGMTGEA